MISGFRSQYPGHHVTIQIIVQVLLLVLYQTTLPLRNKLFLPHMSQQPSYFSFTLLLVTQTTRVDVFAFLLGGSSLKLIDSESPIHFSVGVIASKRSHFVSSPSFLPTWGSFPASEGDGSGRTFFHEDVPAGWRCPVTSDFNHCQLVASHVPPHSGTDWNSTLIW